MKIKISITSALIFLVFNLISQTTSINHYVYFDYNQSSINDVERVKLDSFINFHLSKIEAIQLTGHTDSDGTQAYNLELSKKRVNQIKFGGGSLHQLPSNKSNF